MLLSLSHAHRVQLLEQPGVRGLHPLLSGDDRPLLAVHHAERARRACFPKRGLPQVGGFQEHPALPRGLHGVADVRRLHSGPGAEEDPG